MKVSETRPVTDQRFPLAEAAALHGYVDSERKRVRVLLDMQG